MLIRFFKCYTLGLEDNRLTIWGRSPQGWPQPITPCILFFHASIFHSPLTASINLLCALCSTPPFLLPLPTPASLYPHNIHCIPLWTCPDRLSLASSTLSPRHLMCSVPLMYVLLILSTLLTSTEGLYIFIPTTSVSTSCLFLPCHCHSKYIDLCGAKCSVPNALCDEAMILWRG